MMESNTSVARSPQPSTHAVASCLLPEVIGTLIAVLTLALPAVMIMHFSNRVDSSPPLSHSLTPIRSLWK